MNKDDRSNGGLKLLDAVEALSKIADTPWENEVYNEEIAEIDFKDPHWLQAQDKEEVIGNIKNIFRVILNHLKDCYQEQYRFMGNSKNVEGIKTIMVLVGEAAKKIDRYTNLFHSRKLHSVTETREYKQLQEFYNKKISKTINEAVISKWILALSQRAFKEHEKLHAEEKILDTRHVFVDLDSVKNDTEYELFFIRKPDGTRFFSPRLIRNIKLICDFGFQLGKELSRDPLMDLPIWQDRYGLALAGSILTRVKPVITEYYPLIIHHKALPFFAALHKALLALYLAASQDKLISAGSSKGCLSYLADFQMYLRETLESRNYQQMIAFPYQEFTKEEVAAKKIIASLLEEIFEGQIINDRLSSYFQFLVKESNEILSLEHKKAINLDYPFWSQLAGNLVAMQKYIRYHANGPLNKVLTYLEEGNYYAYDPYLHMRFPEVLYRLNEARVHCLPSPTTQEVINQAHLIPEWISYLHSKRESNSQIVLLNFQDNTSWREYARAHILEDLQEASEFNAYLTVVTLPKDTEFYHQQAPYYEDHQLILFKKHLVDHVLGAHTGFFIPDELKHEITEEWIEGVFSGINRVFFSGKNVLTRDARLDFIEIFYLFLELKILEITHAKELFFICKDGVDTSPTAACSLYFLVKMLNGESFSKEELDALTVMLYKSVLLSRERVLLGGCTERMLSIIKVIETSIHDYGRDGFKQIIEQAFSPYYDGDIRKIQPRTLGS